MRTQICIQVALILLCLPHGQCQTAAAASEVKTDEPFYRAFFFYAAMLDNKAAERTAAGRRTSLGAVHAGGAGLTEAQNNLLMAEVRNHARDVGALDARAKEIVLDIRSRHPGGHLLPGQPLPAVPDELRDLQRRKERLTEDSVQRLKDGLGPEAFERLRQHAIRKIGPGLVRKASPLAARGGR